ncbi:DUF6705 family protein [Chryseobacterium sp. CT-SW4]|uniref:DUF6705 family protein n=1 Tax=Chryseobacterium sp. SW-1 TaxID=3157343 RepID=UPI003B016E35
MKTILKLCILIISGVLCHCYAQESYPKNGDNILNNDIDKFVGTWKWEENGSLFKIVLKKDNVKIPINMDLYGDVLYGWHEYIVNGSIIESNIQYINTPLNDKKYSLFSMGYKQNPKQIKLGIQHLSKNKSVDAQIEYIDSNHIKLISIKNYEGMRLNIPGKTPFDWSISLPKNIILTKQ